MKQLKDPFEAAFKEQEASPTQLLKDESFDIHSQNPDPNPPIASAAALASDRSYQFEEEEDYDAVEEDNYNSGGGKVDPHGVNLSKTIPSSSTPRVSTAPTTSSAKSKFNEDDEEEENMDVELAKFPSSGDPSKMAKMQAILSQLTEEQMSRYESFRRAGFQKSSMKRLLASITGTQKISVPMTIVVSGIAKLFVGELVETARMVMTERKESGPIRPCHLREAYRRLKLEGKVFKRLLKANRAFHVEWHHRQIIIGLHFERILREVGMTSVPRKLIKAKQKYEVASVRLFPRKLGNRVISVLILDLISLIPQF